MRAILWLLLMLSLPSTSQAQDWQSYDCVVADCRFEAPAGWHVRQSRVGNELSIQISPYPLPAEGRYETGYSLRMMNTSPENNPTASAIADEQAQRFIASFTLLAKSDDQSDALRTRRWLGQRMHGAEAVLTAHLALITNSRTGAMYLESWEVPASEDPALMLTMTGIRKRLVIDPSH